MNITRYFKVKIDYSAYVHHIYIYAYIYMDVYMRVITILYLYSNISFQIIVFFFIFSSYIFITKSHDNIYFTDFTVL